ncbi:NAD(P)H-dependent flavin oxidoreductase [Deinococcus apachensis]|uniref:NAD(P)H-dependent flavin oxidoreductase n=1 Tax=Deinococcus apachensis TaxID=309886 RepID=UPI00036713F4|nr:nitronate monooxygenase [Deinococcus apachensis]
MADVLETTRPQVVSFHFGLPSPHLLARVKSWGSLVFSSATTVEEALWLEARGVDAVIAQGFEAGGRRGMFLDRNVNTQIGTFALLPQVVRAVQAPVIAAGGIVDEQGAAAAKAFGASTVQLGRAFLCADEATTSEVYRTALTSLTSRLTALTNVFSGRLARGSVYRAVHELGSISEVAPDFPLASAALSPLRAAAEARGRDDFTPLWCEQNAQGLRSSLASEVGREFIGAWWTG